MLLRRSALVRIDPRRETGKAQLPQITLTPFWRGRIIKLRDALSQKAIAVFYFHDENENLTFLSQS